MTSEKSIEALLKELNAVADDLRSQPIECDKNNIPSALEIVIPGISNIKSLTTLFSSSVDDVLSGAFKAISNGDIDKAVSSLEHMSEILNKVGIGEGCFKGPVSKTIINTIIDSTNDFKYHQIKSHISDSLTSLKKINYILKQLKKKTNDFADKETREKYKDSVYALKKAVRIAIKIYKNRNLVNKRVLRGLKNIITEDVDLGVVEPIE